MRTHLCVLIGATLLALGITPIVARLARATRLLDYPGTRKVHRVPVPRLGGVAIFLAMLGATVPVLVLDNIIGQAFRGSAASIVALLAGSVFMLAVGAADDVRSLRARTKLLAQVLAAVGVCAAGIRIEQVSIGPWFRLDFGWAAWPITVLWIVGITNAVNLIDGLDGLAAGISAIACAVIAVLAIYTNHLVMAVLMLALVGSLCGFLVYNFNPARVFLGDSGTLFVGFVIAASSVMNAAKSAALVGLALPALALGVPIFDTLFSVLRRVLERRSVFAPDRSHIHHRLIAMGLRHRHAVLLMYAVTAAAAGLGMFMMVTRERGTVIIFAGVALLLVLVFRGVGAVRVRESIAAFRRNRDIAREAKAERSAFETAALRIREARSFDAWWDALCAAAEQMGFLCLSVTLQGEGGMVRSLAWRHPRLRAAPRETVLMAFPARVPQAAAAGKIEIELWTNGSLESAGRRAALFGRLIDEQGLTDALPPPARLQQPQPAASRPPG